MRVRIECIKKTDRMNAHERIASFGGRNSDGSPWRLPQADAVAGAKSGKYSFYVERPTGHVVDVVVARSALGHEYLKTVADGEQPNNLLSLPECP
ncbi:MAG: DUF3892 domain-containing protein [Polyangiaceae bacterium]